MNRIFQSPGVWFKGLTYPKKFTVITVIFLLPIIAFLPLLGTEYERINRYGTEELFGTLYTRPLWKIANDLYLHQILSTKFVNGEIEFATLETVQATIDADFEELEARQRQEVLSGPYQGEAAEFKTRWVEIKKSIPNSDAATLEILHEELISDFNAVIIRVGEDSNLVLDPDLDTYYIMDIVLFEIPENQTWTFDIYELANMARTDQSLSSREQEQIASLLDNIETNMLQIDRKIGVVLANNINGNMEPILVPALEEYKAQMQAFEDFVKSRILAGSVGGSSDQSLQAFEKIHKANQDFYTSASNTLQTGVSARVNSSILRFYPIMVVVVASIFGAFLLGQNMMSSISQPLVQLVEASQKLAMGDLTTRMAVQGSGELEKISKAFNKMAEDLEAERTSLTQYTKELEAANQINATRAQEFQFISEISQIIAQEQKLDILLPLIANLVSDKFNVYHVGIFLTDESHQYTVLQAANSEGGQRMLNRSHRLELGTGIVGNVAQSGTPRVALDVGADAVFFNNPDLPATRSEMAIPLNARGVTIGVLDIQSTRPVEFTENVVNTLSILGDQIAIAIENARLFAKTQQALNELQTVYNQYLQKEWQAFRRKSTNIGYHHSGTSGKPLNTPIESDEIQKAVRQGAIILGKQNGSQTQPSMVVPIKLRGETIGVLNIKSPAKDRKWSQDEINMIESVSERLALALENARLFEETNRRAERERLVSEITGKIRSVNDPQAMIQTALEELRNALGASRVQVIPQLSAGNAMENKTNTEEV